MDTQVFSADPNPPTSAGLLRRVIAYVDVIPIALMVAITFLFTVEVPMSDDWDFVPIIQKMKDGTLDWNTLDTPYGGHKIAVPYLVLGGIAIATHWNTYVFRLVNLVLFIGAWMAIRPEAVRDRRLLAVSIFFWSWDQWVAWIWNTPMCCTMAVVCVLWSLRLLKSGSALNFLPAMLLAITGTFCHGTGVAVWPAAAYLIYFTPRPWAQKLAFAAILLFTAYLFLQRPAVPVAYAPDPTKTLVDAGTGKSYLAMPVFMLRTMGAPAGFLRMENSAIVSAIGLLMLLLGGTWEKFRTRPFIGAVLLAGLSMMGLVMVARGGGSFAGQATDSRYGTMAVLFWVAIIMLVEWKGWKSYVLVLLLGLCILRSVTRLPEILRYKREEEVGARGLRAWTPERFLLSGAHTPEAQLDEDQQLIRDWHYSLFR